MFSMIFRDVDSASYSCKWEDDIVEFIKYKFHMCANPHPSNYPSMHKYIYWPFPTAPPRGQKLLVANRQRQLGRQLSAETHQSWFHSCGSSSSVWSPIMILFLRIFFFVVDTHHDLILADAHLIMYWNLNYLLSREDAPCDSNGLSGLYVCVVDQTRLVHHLSYQVGLHSIHLWILNTKQK